MKKTYTLYEETFGGKKGFCEDNIKANFINKSWEYKLDWTGCGMWAIMCLLLAAWKLSA